MSSSSLKTELADHIYQYLCHEAQYSDLPEAARESLTAASECIEQAYRLNVNNNNSSSSNNSVKQHFDATSKAPNATNSNNSNTTSTNTTVAPSSSSSILPDELLRIFTRHKEFLMQQKDSIINNRHPLRNENETYTTIEKPEIRVNSQSTATNNNNNNNNDPHVSGNPNSTTTTTSSNPKNNNTSSVQASSAASKSDGSQAQQSQQHTSKQHNQHPISQLPMTTRKKLSHLRAQIKRQASKAARSRLEKRTSVSGVTSSSGGLGFGGSGSGSGGGGPLAAMLGASSLDASNGTSSKIAGDCYSPKDVLTNQTCSAVFSADSPSTYMNNQSTSSPTGPGGNASGQGDSNISSSSGPHNESGASSSGGPKTSGNLIPGSHNHSSSMGVSVHQKNFKQKLIALIKKFRTDGSDFDSEEQYREALERELMKAAAGRGSRAIEELLEEDIDVEGESGSEPEDWDNISESSTPKPSLRPFFSSTTLDKI